MGGNGLVPQALTEEFAMSLALSLASSLAPLEVLAVTLLLATAVFALIATNARKPILARSALWLAFVTVAGAVYALVTNGVANGAKVPESTVATRSDAQAPARPVSKLMSFTGSSNTAAKKRGDHLHDCEQCPTLVVVPSGWFVMGASANDTNARPHELPAKTIRLTRDFAIGQTEVTVRQFEAFLVSTGHPVPACWATNGGGPNSAATCVSWQDATAYSRWLKKISGRSYRLPTAAEWEYAARAGSGQPYPMATDTAAVQRVSLGRANSASGNLPNGVSGAHVDNTAVAQGSPNYFGLYDVNGGAAELTQDCFSPTLASVSSTGIAADAGPTCERVIKDGMWSEDTSRARFSARRSISPDKAIVGVGFRVVRELNRGRN